MKKPIRNQHIPGVLLVVVVLTAFSILGTYAYFKENHCRIALKEKLLSSNITVCDGPQQQAPKHVCSPGMSCTN
ncbi:hypothetical protein KBD09_02770 [Candidatus Woesebacteria bacterium]|nr:hypothetical protein [Candidatus Woesebacteria bacterium]